MLLKFLEFTSVELFRTSKCKWFLAAMNSCFKPTNSLTTIAWNRRITVSGARVWTEDDGVGKVLDERSYGLARATGLGFPYPSNGIEVGGIICCIVFDWSTTDPNKPSVAVLARLRLIVRTLQVIEMAMQEPMLSHQFYWWPCCLDQCWSWWNYNVLASPVFQRGHLRSNQYIVISILGGGWTPVCQNILGDRCICAVQNLIVWEQQDHRDQ